MVSEPRAEHPHRCTAGHRWQHTGPPALQCEIPAYDPVTGDLPFVAATECPVCCGRQDLLVRGLHPHYCNLCDGEWDHEGVCVDSLAAYCPWCFPKADSEPVPGARRGPHFHYCSECGQNWQHEAGCSAPLRAALPECTGCRATPVVADDQPRPERVSQLPVRPAATMRGRVKPLAVPLGIAAAALLALPIVYKGYTVLRSPAVVDSASVQALSPPERSSPQSPVVAPSVPAPSTAAPSSVATESTAPTPSASSTTPSPALIAPAPPAPTLDAPRPKAEPRAPKTFTARGGPATEPQPRISPPKVETRRAPAIDSARERRARDAQAKVEAPPAARPSAPPSRREDDSRVAPSAPAPSPARSEVAAESVKPTPESPQVASESPVRATPVVVTLPSIPGAPPFGGLSGSSGRDTSLDGHPRRVMR